MINRKISFANFLIWFQIYYNIFIKVVIKDFGGPNALNYVTDMITVTLFICFLIIVFKNKKIQIELYYFIILFTLFLVFGYISVLYNNSQLFFYYWSIRNLCRFFVWFLCVATLLDISTLEKHFQFMEKLILINLFIMVYQYTFLGLRGDYLNGLWGNYAGGNSALNTFYIIITIENITYLFYKKKDLKKVIFNLLIMSISCALNEIKYYYVELILIALAIVIMQLRPSKKSPKKIIYLIIMIGVFSIIGYRILILFYPGFSSFFNKEVFIDYLSRSYNSSKIIYHNNVPVVNRLSAFPIIIKYFLNRPGLLLLGIGMGAGEISSFFTTPFYSIYGPIAYSGFLLPYILLENGIIGLTLYISIYLLIFKVSKKRLCKNGNELALISGVMAIVGIFMCLYNSSLRIESSGYIFFTFLALAFCKKRKLYNVKKSTKKIIFERKI